VTQATQCLRGCALFRDKVPSDKQLDGTKAVHTLGPPHQLLSSMKRLYGILKYIQSWALNRSGHALPLKKRKLARPVAWALDLVMLG